MSTADQTGTLDVPRAFGRYMLLRPVGEGGMAEVYLASVRVAEGLTKRVVIKKIRRDFADQPEFTRMFVDEAKIALSLNHANIVQVFDFGQVRGAFYLAMELIEGVDLMRLFHAVCVDGQRFPTVIAAYIAHQVAAGLAYAHRKRDDFGNPLGIVHRDVSPHNVMVSFEGGVKVLDFGIARTRARTVDPIDTRDVETIKGKVAYMSPEQAMGRPVDARSDIYSLGVVLHELLRGELLYRDRDRLRALERVRTEALPPLAAVAPHLPLALCAIVDRAVQRDPGDRFASARELQSDLASFLHDADPVVDDEVLSSFVRQYQPREHDELESSVPGLDALRTRDVGDSHRSHAMGARPLRESQRVVLVHVALEGERPDQRGKAPDASAFLNLASDVAFKREAHVLRLDPGAVLLAFGAVLTSGDDAERAVRVARTLREEVAESAPGLRVGVVVARTRALVQHGEGGPVAVEVRSSVRAQLDRVARSVIEGPVVVSSDLVERLARTWRLGEPMYVEADAPTRTNVPVDPELEEVVPLLGPRSDAERREAQPLGHRGLLIGRELELKTLRDAFSEAIRARESRTLVITGAPGLGKRALVDRFVGSLPRTACWVLRATARWSRRNVAMGVFLELMARFLRVDQDTPLDQIEATLRDYGVPEAADLAEALGAALGAPGAEHGRPDAHDRRDRLWRLVRRLVAALAARRPVLIVIENLHFIDEPSLELLFEFARSRAPVPLLGLSTGRPGPHVERLRRERTTTVVELRELDARARRELVLRRFEDAEAAGPLAERIVARAGGHPLFIEEILAELLHRGTIGWNEQGRFFRVIDPSADVELPPTVQSALEGRVEALAPGDREVLLAAAILGRVFAPPEVDALIGRSSARALEALAARGLIEPEQGARANPGGSMQFTTVSLHEVCLAAAPEPLRRDHHARAAAIKRARPTYTPGRDDGPIADHLVAAGRPHEAVTHALLAADDAREVAGNVEAHVYLSLAIEHMADDDPRRFDALLQRQWIERGWGRRKLQGADLRRLLNVAERLGDPERIVEASLALLRFYIEIQRLQPAELLLPRLSARIAALPRAEPWLATLGELQSDLLFERGDFESAEAVAREALRYTAVGGSDRAPSGKRQRTRLLNSIGYAHLGAGRFDDARHAFRDALELAREIGDRRLESSALNYLGEAYGKQTRYQDAIDHFKAAIAIDRDLGDRVSTGHKLANLGMTYAAIGLLRRAEQVLRRAFDLHEAVGHSKMRNEVLVELGDVLGERGETEDARGLLLEAAKTAERRGDERTALRAKARLASLLARAAQTVADRHAAREFADEVLVAARAKGLRTAMVRALQVLARLAEAEGRLDVAIGHAREAVELVREGAAPVDGVRSVHHLGLLLRAAGQAAAGDELLRDAAAAVRARALDLRDPDLRRGYLDQGEVRTVLRDGGVDPRGLLADVEAPRR